MAGLEKRAVLAAVAVFAATATPVEAQTRETQLDPRAQMEASQYGRAVNGMVTNLRGHILAANSYDDGFGGVPRVFVRNLLADVPAMVEECRFNPDEPYRLIPDGAQLTANVHTSPWFSSLTNGYVAGVQQHFGEVCNQINGVGSQLAAELAAEGYDDDAIKHALGLPGYR